MRCVALHFKSCAQRDAAPGEGHVILNALRRRASSAARFAAAVGRERRGAARDASAAAE